MFWLLPFRVVFRGARTDKAVLCTDENTFEVKEAETSNSLLLLPKLKLAEESQSVDNGSLRSLEEREVRLKIDVNKLFTVCTKK